MKQKMVAKKTSIVKTPAVKKQAPGLSCANCPRTSSGSPERLFVQDTVSGLTLCNECCQLFDVAFKSIESHEAAHSKDKDLEPLKTPKEIYEALNRDIIKQDDAKKAISNAIAKHFRRLRDPSIGKSNILFIGPTGTGKTEIARSIANILNVPFVSVDASAMTANGYIGESADSIVQRLLIAAKWDVNQAENGIVCIDEVDKIATRQNGQDSGIGTTAVQQQLLKIIEGDEVKVKIPTHDHQEFTTTVNTTKMLFICSGAFVGLEEIIKKKAGSGLKPMGIQAHMSGAVPASQPANILKQVETQHLIQYGLIPEFLGRLPVITSTEALSVDDLVRILKEPQNSLVKQFQKLFMLDHIALTFSDDLLYEIAKEAHQKQIGARGLRQVVELKTNDLFFRLNEYQGKSIVLHLNGRIEVIGELQKTEPQVSSSPYKMSSNENHLGA